MNDYFAFKNILRPRPARYKRPGSGVICETGALQAAVIPAKAGIHSANLGKCAVHGLDSRFRGNDRRFVRDDIPNDTTTKRPYPVAPHCALSYNCAVGRTFPEKTRT